MKKQSNEDSPSWLQLASRLWSVDHSSSGKGKLHSLPTKQLILSAESGETADKVVNIDNEEERQSDQLNLVQEPDTPEISSTDSDNSRRDMSIHTIDGFIDDTNNEHKGHTTTSLACPGLFNRGNLCFLNAILQCLASLPSFCAI